MLQRGLVRSKPRQRLVVERRQAQRRAAPRGDLSGSLSPDPRGRRPLEESCSARRQGSEGEARHRRRVRARRAAARGIPGCDVLLPLSVHTPGAPRAAEAWRAQATRGPTRRQTHAPKSEEAQTHGSAIRHRLSRICASRSWTPRTNGKTWVMNRYLINLIIERAGPAYGHSSQKTADAITRDATMVPITCPIV